MISEEHMAQLRALIESILDERLSRYEIKRRPPEDISEKRRAAARAMLAKRAERAIAEQMLSPKKRSNGAHSRANAEQKLGPQVWAAYAEAFKDKYGVEPTRNRVVNGQLANFAERVGRDAPEVARWYVQHANGAASNYKHSVAWLVKNAETFCAEWKGAKGDDLPKYDNWWSSHAGIDRKGRELGMQARNTESYDDYKARIYEKLRGS